MTNLVDTLYAPYKLFALIQCSKMQGMTAAQVLQGTGFNEQDLEDGKTVTSTSQYLVACNNVIRRCDTTLLPFEVGRSLHLSAYGLYGFALLSSASVRAGFDFAVRYHRLATPMFSIAWCIEGNRFIWTFPDESRLGYPRVLRRFLLSQQLGQHITHVHDIAHVERHPLLINMAFDKPEDHKALEERLGCEVRFNAPSTNIVYDMTILDDRPPLTNPITYAMLRETCESLIGSEDYGGGIAGQVARLVMEIPVPVANMEWAAGRLAITSRTLRRRLAEEGTTFSEIIDQVRSELAKRYLEAKGFTIGDIGELLGFSDTKNFRAFFKRMNGTSPQAFRDAKLH